MRVSPSAATNGREGGDVAGVELQRTRGPAERFDLGDDGGGLVGVGAVGEDDVDAVAGELQRGAAADAAVGAGDESKHADHGGPGAASRPEAGDPGTGRPWIPAAERPILGTCMDRDGLADFLRRRREALRPRTSASAPGRAAAPADCGARRSPRWRSMSTDFYTRLEQRRGSRPSEPMVASIARALRLTQDERDHLFQLAGHVAPPRGHRSSHVSPALMRVLDRLDTPGPGHRRPRHRAAAERARRGPAGRPVTGHNVIADWFTDPAARERYPEADHAANSRSYVAHLRAVHSRSDDAETRTLVKHCSATRSSRSSGSATRSRCAPTPASASSTRSWA